MVTSRIRWIVATAAALLALAAHAGEKQGEPFSLVSVDDVEKMVGMPDVFIVDANPEDVFRKNHVPGARWWRAKPLAQLLPADKDRRLVFYCASPH
jgi:rhodanese-related sulfurtransferase